MIDSMNGDTMLSVEECAKEAGALINCPSCGDLISAGDPDADSLAYAKATNAWKDGIRGFRAMERTEVTDLIKRVLEGFRFCSCDSRS